MAEMKIALVDNMNNNFFTIARYMRDLGVNAELFLTDNKGGSHFLPEADTFDDISLFNWIKEFPVSYKLTSLIGSKRDKLKIFNSYDRIITCGHSVGILNRAGFTTDLFIPYGSDLIETPRGSFGDILKQNTIKQMISKIIRARIQAKGIKQAKKIISNKNWKFAEDAAKSLGIETINLPRLMVYVDNKSSMILPDFNYLKKYDFIVFSPTRHVWKTNPYPMVDFKEQGGYKRNDKLIRAFSRFTKETKYKNPLLLLCDYGDDVAESKLLIESLNISSNCSWLNIMPRKILLNLMKQSNLVADQFRVGMCGTSAGTTNEALACGVPVITNTDKAIFDANDPYYGAPILDALEENDIYFILKDYEQNPDKYKQIGIESKLWFDENLGISLAKKYLELLQG